MFIIVKCSTIHILITKDKKIEKQVTALKLKNNNLIVKVFLDKTSNRVLVLSEENPLNKFCMTLC